MKLIISAAVGIVSAGARTCSRNPSTAAGLFTFGLAFALVATNALRSQPGSHPDPLWNTRDMTVTRSVEVRNNPVLVAHPVLTQKISLRNIPVPTKSPPRRKLPYAHSSIVRDVQAALAEIGFYGGKIDGIFGNETSEAIMAYQDSAGILPNGEASYDLLSSLKSTIAASGSRKRTIATEEPEKTPEASEFNAAIVARIQKGLHEFGYDDVEVDGVMGSQTRYAIERFQRRFDLDVTGEPDVTTLQKLVSIGLLENG